MIRNRIFGLRNLLSKHTILYSTTITPNENKNSVLIQRLLEEFTAAKRVILKLKKYDQMNINFKEWKSRIDAMKNYQFSDLDCFKMISQYPSILEIPLWKLEGTLRYWQLADLGKNYFNTVLISQPVLLDIDENVIRSRVPHLRLYFGSADSMANLLINSPNVMHDNWKEILMKIQYLLKEKCYKSGEISQCSALSQSLDSMKFRFDLLEKCGVYRKSNVPLHKINKYDRSGHVNPSLKSILVTKPEKFVKIAKISLEEYNVYQDLFMANEDDETDSDIDE